MIIVNRDLANYGPKKSKNNIQDVGFLAKCGCHDNAHFTVGRLC
jgi:hypothetical protein